MFERFLQKTIGNKTLVTYGTPSGTDAGGLFCHMQACLGIAGSRLSLAAYVVQVYCSQLA